MIRINLSPEAITQINSRETIIELAVASVVLFLAYMGPGFYAGFLVREAEAINSQTNQNRLALEQLRTDSERINQLKVAISNLKARTELIRNLNKGRKQPVFALDKIQQQHPDRMWLESLSLTNSEISLSGIASEPEIITDYVSRIKKLNESELNTGADIENFQPPFAKYLEGRTGKADPITEDNLSKEAVMPLVVSDVKLLGSEFSPINNSIDAYKFQLSFRINMPGIN
jgi:Tfp pilus assembly protein PilN